MGGKRGFPGLGAVFYAQTGQKPAIFNTMRDSKSLNPGFRDTFLCALCGAEREFLSILDVFLRLKPLSRKILTDSPPARLTLRYIACRPDFRAPIRS